MIRMPGSDATGTNEPGSRGHKPRGSGFNREVLRRGVEQGKSPEQLSKELGTSSVRSVRNAMMRMSRNNHGKASTTLPTGDVLSNRGHLVPGFPDCPGEPSRPCV